MTDGPSALNVSAKSYQQVLEADLARETQARRLLQAVSQDQQALLERYKAKYGELDDEKAADGA